MVTLYQDEREKLKSIYFKLFVSVSTPTPPGTLTQIKTMHVDIHL